MNRTLVATAVLLAAFSMGARTHSGVSMADKVAVDGTSLTLNGMGLRSKMMVKVYVAGLYLEKAGTSAGPVIAADSVKRVELVMLRDLGKAKISEAISEGFEKNSAARMPALKVRLARLIAAVPDLEKEDRLIITYLPTRGTILSTSKGTLVTIEGKDFADALFSVWLGQKPVDEALKKGLLGAS